MIFWRILLILRGKIHICSTLYFIPMHVVIISFIPVYTFIESSWLNSPKNRALRISGHANLFTPRRQCMTQTGSTIINYKTEGCHACLFSCSCEGGKGLIDVISLLLKEICMRVEFVTARARLAGVIEQQRIERM